MQVSGYMPHVSISTNCSQLQQLTRRDI